jgi:hypothetical protein
MKDVAVARLMRMGAGSERRESAIRRERRSLRSWVESVESAMTGVDSSRERIREKSDP